MYWYVTLAMLKQSFSVRLISEKKTSEAYNFLFYESLYRNTKDDERSLSWELAFIFHGYSKRMGK